jgi:pimeloyl-ACP methyl ester carboxylesterase
VVRAILRTVFEGDEYFEKELPSITERLGDRRYKLGLLGTARRVRDANVLPLLPHITSPTLMVYGDRDQIVPVRFAEAAMPLLPHGELVVFEGAGHAPQIERPFDTHARVLSFLGASGWT